VAIDDFVFAGLVDFGEVGALLVLLAEDGDELAGIVGQVGVGQDVLRGVVFDGVFVAAEDVNGVARDKQAGAGDEAAVDGVADGGVGRASALGAHVALGGEAGHEVVLRSLRCDKSAPGNGFLDGLEVFGTGMKEEVDVGVDEAGEERGVAEIDDAGVLRMIDVGADEGDFVANDEDFTGGEDLACVDFKQARGVEEDGGGGLGSQRETAESGK